MNSVISLNVPASADVSSTSPAPATAALLPILVAPDPLLKAKARMVQAADDEQVRALVPRMFATMYQAPGIGLAAPQIGQGLRVIVVDLATDGKREPYGMINPEIIALSDEKA